MKTGTRSASPSVNQALCIIDHMLDQPTVVNMYIAGEILRPGLFADVVGLQSQFGQSGQIHLEVTLIIGEDQGATGR